MPDRPHLPALTGLRSVAALAVAFAHLPHLHAAESIPPVLRRFFAEGFLGVPFFFVLSGFVLAYTYGDRFPALTRSGLAKYYTSRVARIGPVHWLTMAAAAFVPIPGAATNGGPQVLVTTALLLQNWVLDSQYLQAYNPVSWSLSVEAWFYLWLPVLLWWLVRRNWSNRGLLLAACGAWLIAFALTRLAIAHPTLRREWFVVLCPAGRFGEFFVGVALGLIYARSWNPDGKPRVAVWTAIELTAVALAFGQVYTSDRVSIILRQTVYYTPAMAFVVFAFAFRRGLVSRLLSGRAAVYLGEISFSFYMVHAIVFASLAPLGWADVAGPWGRAGIHLVAAGIVAGLVHRWFETPLRHWIANPRRSGHRFFRTDFFSGAILRSSIRR
ncbi:MAG TPA: acyltransferase [Fimbriiglobus sp.]|jgi:peptidoglycan/LPS O-acetylase OafA/YrhL